MAKLLSPTCPQWVLFKVRLKFLLRGLFLDLVIESQDTTKLLKMKPSLATWGDRDHAFHLNQFLTG